MTGAVNYRPAEGFPQANARVDGDAIVYCEGAFRTTNGKTAHGLVRFTMRYRVRAVVDSTCAGEDSGRLLDDEPNGIAVFATIAEALADSRGRGTPASHLVVGLAPDGGRLPDFARHDLLSAIHLGLHVDSGLHDYITDDPVLADAARRHHVRLRDVRKPPPREQQYFFSGKIEEVKALKIAVLGTDSAVGKRTTAWILLHGLRKAGYSAEMVGTGQTAWMQGVPYGLILDSTISDFMAGGIEHAIWSAWADKRPDVIVIPAQGSLMNPAYPGGSELLAAGRPDAVILQHAPARIDYDGFPGYPIQPLARQIQAIEILSGKPVIAIALSHEGIAPDGMAAARAALAAETGLPVCDPLRDDPTSLIEAIRPLLVRRATGRPVESVLALTPAPAVSL